MMNNCKKSGFTLIETIIYIGLFSLIFTGIFVSIYPLMTGAERLSRNVAIEGETAFILAKIDYAVSSTMTDGNGNITTPNGDLVLSYNGTEKFRFADDTSSSYCATPLICRVLTLKTGGGSNPAIPLNAQRVQVENFFVAQTGTTGTQPHYIDVSFDVNEEHVGPVRYYLHF